MRKVSITSLPGISMVGQPVFLLGSPKNVQILLAGICSPSDVAEAPECINPKSLMVKEEYT